ncbi:MAG: hypothetical protein LLF80_01315 [Porphyromonadaceae bacterium]|nr:hypothetical protein [Porphyromonadaceae bacterium]
MKVIKEPVTEKYANQMLYTDIHPFEVIRQRTDNTIEVREMDAEITEESKKDLAASFRPGGFLGHTNNSLQKWSYSSNAENPIITIRKHKDGRWYAKDGSRYVLRNAPEKFYDYNF